MSMKQKIWIGAFSFLLIVNLVFLVFNLKNKNDLSQDGIKVTAKIIERMAGVDDSYFYELIYLVDSDSIQNSISSLNYYEVGEEIDLYYSKEDIWIVLPSAEVETSNTVLIQLIVLVLLIILIVVGFRFPNLINRLKADTFFTID